MKRFVSLFLLMTIFAGCNGGLNCPATRPSCCTNILFGCGTFDLPFGCTCDQYGYFGAPPVTQRSATVSSNLNGDWRGTLALRVSSCPNLMKKVKGAVEISERNRQTTISVPGYGKLRGRKNGTSVIASGTYSNSLAGCDAHISTTMRQTKPGKRDTSVTISYRCGEIFSCTALYNGSLKRS